MNTFNNPVLPGFYPDPSVCRVGGDFYLVTSTFEYFPGVPVFHSRDLVHWRQIGHVLERPSQLNLDDLLASKGIWAPTIRFYRDRYYVITTLVMNDPTRRNFYVTAENPAGPWSDPVFLEGAPGIDPSLFFDEDGRVWYTGTRTPPQGEDHPKDREIWCQEVDIERGCLTGERYGLWRGALRVAHAQEGPHLYKRGRYYYLLIAEGGTGFTHAVTVARSENLLGPYSGNPSNPILTHRHMGKECGIVNVGHADIFDTDDGDWWMVCLASRPYGGYYRNLGRETFLVPVVWEDDWPVVSPGRGRIGETEAFPALQPEVRPSLPVRDSFDSEKLDLRWNFLRTPRGDFWSLKERPGFLRLKLKPDRVTEHVNPSFLGRRQQHMNFAARAVMEFQPQGEYETAGLLLLQNPDFQFRLERTMENRRSVLRLVSRREGREEIPANVPLDAGKLYFKVEARGQDYSFFYGTEAEDWKVLYENADGRILSTDLAGGFTGAYIGMFASSNGMESANHADFDWFEYTQLDE